MGTINFSVPDDLKEAFNTTFEGQNKSAVIAHLMRDAIAAAQRRQRSRDAIGRILDAYPHAPVRDAEALHRARDRGRP